MKKEETTFRQEIHKILQNRSNRFWGKLIQQFLFWLIIINVFVAILETLPSNPIPDFLNKYFLIFSICIFSLEYIGRLWTATLNKGITTGKDFLLFILSPLMLLDLAVIAPFYLPVFSPMRSDLVIFRFVRIFRAIRLIKYTTAFNRIMDILRKEKEELATVLFMMLVMLVMSSTLLYFAEHNVPGTQFTSIPATFWWGIATLTTIGYGDMVPVTIAGKILGSITAILGVGLFALPTGLLGASFYQDVTKSREQQLRKMRQQIGVIQSYTEENEEKFEQFSEKQKRKIDRLEQQLAQAKIELEEQKHLDL